MTLNLALNDYSLLEYAHMNGVHQLKAQLIKSGDIDQIQNQLNTHGANYPQTLQDDLHAIGDKYQNVMTLVKLVYDDIQSGDIKTEDDTIGTGVIFESDSFKRRFRHHALGLSLDANYINFQPYGKYHIEMAQASHDIHLNTLLEDGGYDQLKKEVEQTKRFEQLLKVMDYQRDYQQNHDESYRPYMEVKQFQHETGMILSSQIESGQRPNDEEMKRIYDKYQRIIPLQKQIQDIIYE